MAMKGSKKDIILLVDDQPANLKVLSSFLQFHEFDIRIHESGKHALEMLQHISPDIILLDIMMPEMDGFSTYRKIKADPRIADIPIIFLTALDDAENKLAGFEVGGVDYITKPFQKAEVLARLNTHLTLQKMQRELGQALSEVKSFSRDLEHRVQKRTFELQESNKQLKIHKQQIEEKNIALKVLLDQHQLAHEEYEDHITARLKKLVFPYLDMLQQDVTKVEKK